MRVYSNTISKLGLLALLFCAPAWAHAAGEGQYLGWGDQLLGQRRYADASRYYTAVVRSDPRSEAAYRGLGYCYLGQRDQAHAAQYLEYALRLNPGDQAVRGVLGRIYQDYGNAYYRNRDQARAQYWWKRSLAVNPNNGQLRAYVYSAPQAQAPAAPAAAPAPAAQQESLRPTPGINPWLMGGTIAVLGIVMIVLF